MTFKEWKQSLTSEQRWSHCGELKAHNAHTHTIVMNEGPYHGVVCIGTPRFSKPRATED